MEPEEARNWQSSFVSRRTLLRGGVLGGVGLAAAALIGCGDDDDDDEEPAATQPSTTTTTTQATATAAASGGTAAADDSADEADEAPAAVADADRPYPLKLAEETATPKPGGVLRFGHTISIQTVDPITSAAGGTVTVPNVSYDRLVGHVSGLDVNVSKLETKPELAGGWELSSDGLTMTFTLRDDVKWQNVAPLDGRPFTSTDVKFALERYQSATSVHRGLVRKISSIDTPDDSTAVLNLSEPWPDALVTLGTRFTTIHPRELVDDGSVDRNAVGTGPMILTELADDRAIFEKNPDYWRQEVLLDGFEILSIPDLSARLARYRVGQLDFAGSLLPDKSAADQLLETNPDERIVMSDPVGATFTVALNLMVDKYQDERVRRALQMAIDRALIVDLVYEGLGIPAAMMPWSYLHDAPPSIDQLPYYQFDPAEAKKMISAAGADGLEIDMIYFNYSPSSNERQNQIIQQNFADIGVELDASAVDYTQFNSAWIPADYPDAADGWAPQGQQADNWWFDHLHSESPANRWHINDSQLDEWTAAQSVEIDPAARAEIWQLIWDRALDQSLRITKPVGNGLTAYPPHLRGVFWGGALGANSWYYDWGEQIANAWLDT